MCGGETDLEIDGNASSNCHAKETAKVLQLLLGQCRKTPSFSKACWSRNEQLVSTADTVNGNKERRGCSFCPNFLSHNVEKGAMVFAHVLFR